MSFKSRITIYFKYMTLVFLLSFCFAELNGAEPRKTVPGAMHTIRPIISYADTYQWATMLEIASESPNYRWAENLFYNREIWCLEFKFKTVRIIDVDFPLPNGTLKTVKVWYLVYSVTNTGKCVRNEIDIAADTKVSVLSKTETGEFKTQKFDIPNNNLRGLYKPVEVDYSKAKADKEGKVPGTIRFTPKFVLASSSIRDRLEYESSSVPGSFFKNKPSGAEEAIYYDEFLPLAFVNIVAYEDPSLKYENSVTFPRVEIKPGETYWGIATWADVNRQTNENKIKSVDPRIDRFSVYVSGLSNALRWEDDPSAFNPKSKFLEGRTVFRKVLKLNFVRPGDEFNENSKEFHFGAPGELDHSWIYL